MIDQGKNFETWEQVIVDFFESKVSNKQSVSTEIRKFIDSTSKKKLGIGKKTVKATHVLKFTHSSSSPASLLLKSKANDMLISTSSFKKDVVLDLAHSNGNLITVSRFLNLSLNGKKIFDLIIEDKSDFLQPFALDQSMLETWFDGFKGLVEEREIKTADMAKQIYFPVKYSLLNKKYHLLVPLFSSSLANELGNTIMHTKKQLRRNRKDDKYFPGEFRGFSNLAVQNFGGSKPHNISMLNANRRGKSYLLSTQPPTWQSQFKPPSHNESIFDESFFRSINNDINHLRKFLLRFQHADLSINNPERRKWIGFWFANITENFLFFYASCIQDLPSSWSAHENIKLKLAHQYLLDPYRKDKAFQVQRKSVNWQAIVCEDFADWLNSRLMGKDKQFTPQPEHRRMWVSLLKQPLREHCEELDLELKSHLEVEA